MWYHTHGKTGRHTCMNAQTFVPLQRRIKASLLRSSLLPHPPFNPTSSALHPNLIRSSSRPLPPSTSDTTAEKLSHFCTKTEALSHKPAGTFAQHCWHFRQKLRHFCTKLQALSPKTAGTFAQNCRHFRTKTAGTFAQNCRHFRTKTAGTFAQKLLALSLKNRFVSFTAR